MSSLAFNDTGRVPVIVLSGHLGAGKTTLLNHLLSRPGARVGVVVNDFGAVNVDAALVTGQIDEPVSISGGCLCCLGDVGGLDLALERLTDPRRRLDAVIVEASGIAEPAALAWMIRASKVARVRPGGVIDVVDAVEHFTTVDFDGPPPARFAVATLAVINKIDRLPADRAESALASIEARIREVNPGIHIVRTSRGRVDPELVYDVASADDPQDELPLAALARQAHHRESHRHAAAVTVRAAATVDPGRLIELCEDPPPGAYRIKGTVTVDTGRRLGSFTVNVVGDQVHIADRAEAATGGELVAIGTSLDPETVRPRLEAALASTDRRNPEGLRRLLRLRDLSR
ncbi:GTP-binding protein [Glycomyces luteolus]|uniref:GTP-binding protein n=1 Tax=Glycomyces luteolus TaxID=2670330 RepID=A0A9X3PAK5_9ACTN|nr:CobW family GTP-binding protein [Glycomyces luteolus]MDA1361477.1 GTP-binding protein [Glycomyces luteolus]